MAGLSRDLVREARREVDMARAHWASVRDFDDACHMMATSLRDGLPWVPGNFIPSTDEEFVEAYESGALDEESMEILDDLVKINRLGFLTTFSQPAADKIIRGQDGKRKRLLQTQAISGVTTFPRAHALLNLPSGDIFVDVEGDTKKRPVTTVDGKVFTHNSPMPMSLQVDMFKRAGMNRAFLEQLRSECVAVSVTARFGYGGMFRDIIDVLDKAKRRR